MHHETRQKKMLREACHLVGIYSHKQTNKNTNPNKVVIDEQIYFEQ